MQLRSDLARLSHGVIWGTLGEPAQARHHTQCFSDKAKKFADSKIFALLEFGTCFPIALGFRCRGAGILVACAYVAFRFLQLSSSRLGCVGWTLTSSPIGAGLTRQTAEWARWGCRARNAPHGFCFSLVGSSEYFPEFPRVMCGRTCQRTWCWKCPKVA